MRTKRTTGSSAYTYTYIGGQLTYMSANGQDVYITHDASGQPMTINNNGTTYYYATNLQGDVTAIVNTSGTAVVTYTYDAWGNILSTGGTMASTLSAVNPLRYRGYVYDQETGLYYLQSRYYNPALGRFINGDAFATTGQGLLGNNTFAYCQSNPVAFRDDAGYLLRSALNNTKEGFYRESGSAGVIPGGIIGTGLLLDLLSTIQRFWEETKVKVEARASKQYTHETEDHHIAAQKAFNAKPAALILWIVYPDEGVESPANIVTLKTGVHRVIHTKLYYGIANFAVISAFGAAGNDIEQARKNVTATLIYIGSMLKCLEQYLQPQ